MVWPDFILFASDATLVGLWAGGFALLALLALAMDWRRAKRRDIDAVGCMPWTTLFMLSATMAGGLLILAVKGWLAG